MLHKIEIENFFSIREKQVIDFTVPRNATDPDGRFASPLENPEYRVPRVIVLFGANASGKTNVLRAIQAIRDLLKTSASPPSQNRTFIIPFASDEAISKPTRIAVEFNVRDKRWKQLRFRYELIYSAEKKEVLQERLAYFPVRKRRLFERTTSRIKTGLDFGLSERDRIFEKIRPETSVLSVLAQFNHALSMTVVLALSTLSNVVGLEKLDRSADFTTGFYAHIADMFYDLKTEIRRFDIGVKDIALAGEAVDKSPRFSHEGLDRPLPLELESHGTQQFYKIFPHLWSARKSGEIAVLDELDNDVHPLILPELIRQFQNPESNPLDAQLIMSCHDATLLEHLEKEEVYFTEKDSSGATEMYGLKDIKGVRRDTNIYAKYLSGAFGAVPKVG